ncbi:hypothetical protein [Mechercharimyces sp. CAU 1602]|uniref:hypothetical protein n=1 Tax=Mechercharimyces sp. CAU 1602 TaxID=2973933 RepID=UPI002162F444|nr:hypothetical protein [Mechercharimyces sp. CAU 1602]MCS1350572.1 hypothetical protein [Mechercharimyces sp. CAU 1602]
MYPPCPTGWIPMVCVHWVPVYGKAQLPDPSPNPHPRPAHPRPIIVDPGKQAPGRPVIPQSLQHTYSLPPYRY